MGANTERDRLLWAVAEARRLRRLSPRPTELGDVGEIRGYGQSNEYALEWQLPEANGQSQASGDEAGLPSRSKKAP